MLSVQKGSEGGTERWRKGEDRGGKQEQAFSFGQRRRKYNRSCQESADGAAAMLEGFSVDIKLNKRSRATDAGTDGARACTCVCMCARGCFVMEEVSMLQMRRAPPFKARRRAAVAVR